MPSRFEDLADAPPRRPSSSRAIRRGAFSTTVTSAPKRRIHLRELEADVAAADDDQMLGHAVERQHRRVGEERHVVDARHVGHERAAADVDEDARRGQQLVADADGVRALEPGVPLDDRAAGHAAQPFLDAGRARWRDGVGARLDLGHVDPDAAVEDDAVVGGAAREVRGIGAGDQRLGRHAAGVDAGAAEELALDERDLHAGAGQPAGERRPGLAGADDDGGTTSTATSTRRSTAPCGAAG